MRIGELSRETGVPVETIRYYEKAWSMSASHKRPWDKRKP